MNSPDNLSGAFDLMAEHYDVRYTENPSMALMRRRVRHITTPYLHSDMHSEMHVLELGSGTGEDAVFLAEHGCNVLATDCSQKMLDLIADKAASNKLESRIRCQLLNIHNMISLLDTNEAAFHGIFSNFGGLNTIHELSKLNTVLTKLLKPGGWFIACVMGRHCIWDYLVDLCQLKINRLGKRRTRDGVVIGVGDFQVTCYFPTPKEFINAFPGLELEYCQALGLLLPPPRLTSECLKPLWTMLDKIEQPFSKMSIFQGCGDHFLIVMRKLKVES